jgi:hypothetical protein
MAYGEYKGRYVRLLENRRYPTFQLCAEMANKKTDPRDGLRLGALIAMEWLRKRLGDRAPAELAEIPSPERWLEVGDECLTPLYCSRGDVADIVSLPEKGVWTLQVTEPDLGSDPGDPDQRRAAVPGRIFETNIGFRVLGDRLVCGFQTVVSDPEGTPMAEVYRLAVIHQLIRHRDFGLKHVVPLSHRYTRLKTARDLEALLDLLDSRENQLPCVVFTQVEKDAPPPAPPQEIRVQASWRVLGAPELPMPTPEQLAAMKSGGKGKKQAADPAYDCVNFAYWCVTLCHTFLLEQPLIARFADRTGLNRQRGGFEPGDVAVLEPRCFGGGKRIIPYDPARCKEVQDQLKGEILAYPRGRSVDFGKLGFLSSARRSLDNSLEEARSQLTAMGEEKEDQRLELESRITEMEQRLRSLDQTQGKIDALQAKLDAERDRAEELDRTTAGLRRELEKAKEDLGKLEREKREQQELADWYKSQLDWPRRCADVPDWVKKTYGGKLLFLNRAETEIKAADLTVKDMGFLCKALDHLATNYWDQVFGGITEEEAITRAARKYGKAPFEIGFSNPISINRYRQDYQVTYGEDGHTEEMNRHLKVNGKDGKIRIYFFLDKEKRLIVVGSLPGHLSTVTYG